MIVDSHCHLDFSKLYDNLDEVIKRADLNNVKCLLSICTTLESYSKIILIVNKYKNVFGTFGIHPHETKNYEYLKQDLIIKKAQESKKIIGIGETGLDYFYNHSEKKIQKKSFIEHIKSALELDMPVIVHSRNAELDTYEILKEEKRNSNLKILMHCFTGSKDFAKKLIDIGCYISFSGIITFNNSSDLADAVSVVPVERLLIETDSPYLSPIPLRGKSNEPSNIIHTLKKLSEIKKASIDSIESSTTNNFKNLFNLSDI
mgnify:CR=1 FL=1